MKAKLSNKTLENYKNRIKLRQWLSWDEYITLKVGDELIMPEFFENTDKKIGTCKITIKELWKEISKDRWDVGLEHGCLSGSCISYYDNNDTIRYGYIGGTFAVNINESEEVETLESVKNKVIKAAISYISEFSDLIDIENYEKYLRSV